MRDVTTAFRCGGFLARASRRGSRNACTIETAKRIRSHEWNELICDYSKMCRSTPLWRSARHLIHCVRAVAIYGLVCYARTVHIGSPVNRYVKPYFGSVYMTCLSAFLFPSAVTQHQLRIAALEIQMDLFVYIIQIPYGIVSMRYAFVLLFSSAHFFIVCQTKRNRDDNFPFSFCLFLMLLLLFFVATWQTHEFFSMERVYQNEIPTKRFIVPQFMMSDSSAVSLALAFHKPSYSQAPASNYSTPLWPSLTSFFTIIFERKKKTHEKSHLMSKQRNGTEGKSRTNLCQRKIKRCSG